MAATSAASAQSRDSNQLKAEPLADAGRPPGSSPAASPPPGSTTASACRLGPVGEDHLRLAHGQVAKLRVPEEDELAVGRSAGLRRLRRRLLQRGGWHRSVPAASSTLECHSCCSAGSKLL